MKKEKWFLFAMINMLIANHKIYAAESKYSSLLEPEQLFSLILILILTIVAFCIWYKYGKDRKVIPVVEFYPPEELDCLEIAYCYRGKARDRDIIPLILQLANKGYITISGFKKLNYTNENSFRIKKVKEYDGDNEAERILMRQLFVLDSSISSFALGKKLAAASSFVDSLNKTEIYEKTITKYNLIVLCIMIFSLCFSLIVALDIQAFAEVSKNVLYSIIIVIIGFCSQGPSKFEMSILVAFLAILIFGSASYSFIENGSIILLAGTISFLLTGIMFVNMPRRSKHGAYLLGRIIGFKEFLTMATKEEIEQQIKLNPTYVYDILPYMYALDLPKKCMKKFEDLISEAPKWYESEEEFDTVSFSEFVNNLIEKAAQNLKANKPSTLDRNSDEISKSIDRAYNRFFNRW